MSSVTQEMKGDGKTKTKKILITGGAGRIAYALMPLICSGNVFGPNTNVSLVLFDIPPMLSKMEGFKMELIDGAYPLVDSIECTVDPATAFGSGMDVAVFLGGFPRKEGMLRSDVLGMNAKIFKASGEQLEKYAKNKATLKVVVVANPANTNCWILRKYARSIPAANFSALTRLDQNRACGQIALRTGARISEVHNMLIWGNHSKTQHPDIRFVKGATYRPSVSEHKEFIKTVQGRGAAIIKQIKSSSAMSAAQAVVGHLRDWIAVPTPLTRFVSMSVVSQGDYGIPSGLVFSMPCQCSPDNGGTYQIYKGLETSSIQQYLQANIDDLKQEIEHAMSALGEAGYSSKI